MVWDAKQLKELHTSLKALKVREGGKGEGEGEGGGEGEVRNWNVVRGGFIVPFLSFVLFLFVCSLRSFSESFGPPPAPSLNGQTEEGVSGGEGEEGRQERQEGCQRYQE
jgi:hypothetical protein